MSATATSRMHVLLFAGTTGQFAPGYTAVHDAVSLALAALTTPSKVVRHVTRYFLELAPRGPAKPMSECGIMAASTRPDMVFPFDPE